MILTPVAMKYIGCLRYVVWTNHWGVFACNSDNCIKVTLEWYGIYSWTGFLLHWRVVIHCTYTALKVKGCISWLLWVFTDCDLQAYINYHGLPTDLSLLYSKWIWPTWRSTLRSVCLTSCMDTSSASSNNLSKALSKSTTSQWTVRLANIFSHIKWSSWLRAS